ncbi:hypothetical protein [Nocardia farcinica]|uniref:Uncharacterized protein n=1 Tax=Nocardia farcinica (strain IFM 10152) TaxID=247156 RepID=Q5YSG5_NOCFA|nr:hypothetical protein [Nocardia farcinica]BAD58876.1 hypothetical protein NFA_40280 [Nocardia farcinica IFM 10152]
MSRIYFHSPSGDAEVSGRERTHFGLITHETSIAHLIGTVGRFNLRRVLHPESWAYQAAEGVDTRMLSLALGPFGEDKGAFVHNGKRVNHWHLLLNTLIQQSGDSIRLAARIHAQCEVHGYVEGPDRAWLADLIEDARVDGVFRADMGWETVIELLRARDDEPVVMSYSLCDPFPNPWSTTWTPESVERADDEDDQGEDRESWYQLPHAEQWATGLAWLRDEANGRRRLQPDTWADFGFGEGLTATDLANSLTAGTDA